MARRRLRVATKEEDVEDGYDEDGTYGGTEETKSFDPAGLSQCYGGTKKVKGAGHITDARRRGSAGGRPIRICALMYCRIRVATFSVF